MRTVIIGAGAISSRWIRTIRQDGRLTIAAVVEPDAQRAQRVVAQHGLEATVFSDLDNALGTNDLHVVVNLTPPDLHAGISAQALDAGLHVLSEKPLATTVPDARLLIGLAERRGLVLAVMRNRGDDPYLIRFRDLVAERLAPPYLVHATISVTLPEPGFRTGIALPATTDLAVHAFDQVQHLVHATPMKVNCVEVPCGFLAPHSTTSAINVVFADGSVLVYRGGLGGSDAARAANGMWEIQSANGIAAWDGEKAIRVKTAKHAEQLTLPGVEHPNYVTSIIRMIDRLFGHDTMPNHEVTLRSIAMLQAAMTSAVHDGRWAEVDLT